MHEVNWYVRASGLLGNRGFAVVLAVVLGSFGVTARAANLDFRRGDTNGDARFDLSDPIQTLGFLFQGSPTSLACRDAADSNDSGSIDLSDTIYSLAFLFQGGPAPPSPGHTTCGPDGSLDALDCNTSPCAQGPTPPSAPTGLAATAGSSQVSLDWNNNPEGDLAGYNVYRSTTAGSGHVKINGPLLPASNYTDSSAANGTRYYYKVTAVDTGAEESAQSTEVSALPTGATPPSVPTGLGATAGNSQVNLDWNNNPEGDLAGYNVYRSTTAGSGHVKINGPLLPASNYTDTSVTNGTRYYYRVTAVDTGAEESARSTEVSSLPTNPGAPSLEDIGHVLNRLAHGPTQADIEYIQQVGLEAYIDEQLNPQTIDESGNTRLNQRVDALFTERTIADDTSLFSSSLCKYLKGTAPPPVGWNTLAYSDAGWEPGAFGIGYGDGDDVTVLNDMEDGYMSVFIRKTFTVADPSTIDSLILDVDYDDGFVAYLNGSELTRSPGFAGNPPAYNAAAPGHDIGTAPFEFDVTARKNLIAAGPNVLAIQVHNNAIGSSDLSMNPVLLDRTPLPGPPVSLIGNLQNLAEYHHTLGVYSEKQLQAKLAWMFKNLFTTDGEKVAEYFDMLVDAAGGDAMSAGQAMEEASQLQFEDYDFLYDNALGDFGTILKRTMLGVSMLIYLDNVTNVVGTPNENLAREIFELYAMGVNNGYTQTDLEQFARVLTGWTVCKVERDEVQAYPDSITNPPTVCGVQFSDSVVLGLGAGWKYVKGTGEPSPAGDGSPTAAWTEVGFVDSGWTNAAATTVARPSVVGYGDSDDATDLLDMQNGYVSVYIRRTFNLTQAQIDAITNLVLEVGYDDGFVAYLNGADVGRSETMEGDGNPPPYTAQADETHEVTEAGEVINLNGHVGRLNVGANVLAIQIHNAAPDSSDLSILPQLKNRTILGGVEVGDARGVWATRFDPSKHDTGAKTIFAGKSYQINIAAGQTGAAGRNEALTVLNKLAEIGPTAEFVSIRLIQTLVSEELTLASYKDNSAPAPLKALLADAIAAWNSTTNPPSSKGNITKVLRVILDPANRASLFWSTGSSPHVRLAKVKDPIMFNASTVRAVDGLSSGTRLSQLTDTMGMTIFRRDEPNGYGVGAEMLNTGTMLDGINGARAVATNTGGVATWNATTYLSSRGLDTAGEIIDHFNNLLFSGRLTAAEKALLNQFLTTDDNYNPSPLSPANLVTRTQELVGLMLSQPHWNRH